MSDGATPRERRSAIGLVLGAGGVVGQAYQAGVLAALEREAHWDARDADIIVGTSAGSVTGAALTSGCPGHRPRRLDLRPADVPPGRGPPQADHHRGEPSPRAVGHVAPAAMEPAFGRPHQTHCPTAFGLPARRGHNDAPAPGPDRYQCTGRRPARAHRRRVARGTVDLRARSGPTGPGSSSAARGHRQRAWPRPCWRRAPSPATSPRSPSAAPSTSTAACTRGQMRTCSRRKHSTW